MPQDFFHPRTDPCEKFVAEALQNFIKRMADGYMEGRRGKKEKKSECVWAQGRSNIILLQKDCKTGTRESRLKLCGTSKGYFALIDESFCGGFTGQYLLSSGSESG